MIRARTACARFSTHFNLLRTRPFCSSTKDSNNNKKKNKDNVDGSIESNVSTYNESYRQLDNLDFMTAAKILFTHPPKKKKFGCILGGSICSLRNEKNGSEEEKAKEMELIATEHNKGGTDTELLEVKVRLGKLEEAVKEIVVESKKQSAGSITKSQQNASEPGEAKRTSESSSTLGQDKLAKQKSTEQTLSFDQGKVRSAAPVSDASQKDQKGENQKPSQDAKK
ncbi:hypothetical protein POUND7_003791 [Theobroma cacao]